MTGDDERTLRGQLAVLLDNVPAPPPPTTAVIRKGKAMRTRRRASVAAGIAVLAVGAVGAVAAALTPGLVRDLGHPGPQPPNGRTRHLPKVTAGRVGPHAPSGLIAVGTINGKPWHVTINRMGKDLCLAASGDLPWNGCGPPDTYGYLPGAPVSLQGGGGPAGYDLAGPVIQQVRKVSLMLADGAVLDLHPVRFDGGHWIAVEIPAQLRIVRAVAFAGRGELAYAIPFYERAGSMPNFVRWLRPGQPVPPVLTRALGSGVFGGKRWSAVVHAGPWGWCVVPDLPGESTGPACETAPPLGTGRVLSGGVSTPGQAWWTVGAVSGPVALLTVTLADGATVRIPTVLVSGSRMFATVMAGPHPRITRWAAYDAAGRQLSGGTGTPAWLGP